MIRTDRSWRPDASITKSWYMYTCTNTHIQKYVLMHIHIHIHIHIPTYHLIYIYICIHIYMYIYMYVYISYTLYLSESIYAICLLIYIYIYIHTFSYLFVCTYALLQVQAQCMSGKISAEAPLLVERAVLQVRLFLRLFLLRSFLGRCLGVSEKKGTKNIIP